MYGLELRAIAHVPLILSDFAVGLGPSSAKRGRARREAGLGQDAGGGEGLPLRQKGRHAAQQDLPIMEIDAQTYEVTADGVQLTCAPAKDWPMAQRYFCFDLCLLNADNKKAVR